MTPALQQASSRAVQVVTTDGRNIAGGRAVLFALREIGQNTSKPIVIAHELTPHTRTALQSGLIEAVLNQDAGHEVRSAIRVLKARADGIGVIEAQERIRIDIFIKDNLP